jgi:hypothetical protein
MSDVKTTTYTTDYNKSLAEEVDKLISNVSPTDTPLLSTIGSSTCESIHPEWLEDELDDAGSNKQIEGFEPVSVALTPPARLENYTQILSKDFIVSGSLEEAKKHGRKSELQYQTGLKMKSIANDLEWNSLNSTKAAGDGSTARSMAGALAFAHADNTYTFGGTAAATNHLTEEILLDIMQSMWELGGKPDTILAPPSQKRKISAFTDDGRLTVNTGAAEKKVTMTVRIIETDFGTVAVIPERHIAPTGSGTLYDSVLIYEKGKLESLTFRPLKREQLAKTGDNTKYMLVMEKSLKCRSTKCVGKITNLTRVKA